MNASRKRQRGFTLTEALIAVAVLAGLASALAPAVFGSLGTSTKIVSLGAEREAIRVGNEALGEIFGNVIVLASEPAELNFQGRSNQISLVSLAGPGATPRKFNLQIDSGALHAEITSFADDHEQQTILLPRGAIEFSYFGAPDAAGTPSWTTAWNYKIPPRLIRLELNSPKKSKPSFLEYAVTPNGVLHCAFDPVSRRCRN